ncbi:MAG: DUF4199 domain-containing protein [Prevotella sp.]|nr:DUF4199 domain-containing protein [Bacteroides sp.]MCM1366323.1 DUF4199 domain-containing protein [Prevotella sp.]MCM1437127.1 DUF4199 domain-containing protein [Prevotella sp.]
MQRSIKEIIGYASKAGLPMGIYLTAMTACMLGTLYWDSFSLIGLVMSCGVPVLLWRLLMPLSRDAEDIKFGPIWLAGIYIFIFGGFISGLFTAIYMIWIEPGFFSLYIEKYLAMVENMPDSEALNQQADILRRMLENNLMPRAMEFVSAMMWATGFFGSLLSGVVAFIMMKKSQVGKYMKSN